MTHTTPMTARVNVPPNPVAEAARAAPRGLRGLRGRGERRLPAVVARRCGEYYHKLSLLIASCGPTPVEIPRRNGEAHATQKLCCRYHGRVERHRPCHGPASGGQRRPARAGGPRRKGAPGAGK